jgi:hypothetical protein
VRLRRELCGFHKHGGVAISSATALAATKLAERAAAQLHETITSALTDLDARILEERMKTINIKQQQQQQRFAQGHGQSRSSDDDNRGILRADDPMLAINVLHRPVTMSN